MVVAQMIELLEEIVEEHGDMSLAYYESITDDGLLVSNVNAELTVNGLIGKMRLIPSAELTEVTTLVVGSTPYPIDAIYIYNGSLEMLHNYSEVTRDEYLEGLRDVDAEDLLYFEETKSVVNINGSNQKHRQRDVVSFK